MIHSPSRPPVRGRVRVLVVLTLVAMAAAFGVAFLLVTVVEHRQEARTPFVRVVEVDEASTDPAAWGLNWPAQHDGYRRTVDFVESEHGGSSALAASKLEKFPWLRRLYSGYAFSIDYREARGHAYMLHDQEVTERVTKRKQSGACLHCHASIVPTYRRLGLEERGRDASPAALASAFDWPAVLAGFRAAGALDYAAAHGELVETERAAHAGASEGHPVGCVDCHDPETMRVRVTRPGFVLGLAALAEGDAPVPHLPSIERWRAGPRSAPYDANADASRQEMRSFVCGQCHVEYYCGSKETLFFPWERGLTVEDIEETYESHRFPDGSPFADWEHGETGAPVFKAQHPEFELWSQGVHAQSGVACADCHMPYERSGAMKVSSHWVRSPLLNVNNACQTCHHVPEEELVSKVRAIQGRTEELVGRAANAMTDMLDAIREAQAAGATDEDLAPALEAQRRAMWRLDFVSSENSRGFHADQESARILGGSIDESRKAQAFALRWRAPAAPAIERPAAPVEGVTEAAQPR